MIPEGIDVPRYIENKNNAFIAQLYNGLKKPEKGKPPRAIMQSGLLETAQIYKKKKAMFLRQFYALEFEKMELQMFKKMNPGKGKPSSRLNMSTLAVIKVVALEQNPNFSIKEVMRDAGI